VILTCTLVDHGPTRESWGVGTVTVRECDPPGASAAGDEVRVSSPQLANAIPGEDLQLEGEFENHPRYGRQFVATRQVSCGINDEREAHRWLTRLDGVGFVLARRIFEHFGGQGGVLAVLRAEPGAGGDRLAEVSGVSERVAKLIRDSWAGIGASADPETLAYLDGLKLTRYEVNCVVDYAKRQGTTPRKLLAERPYDLTNVKGLGFRRVDSVALRAGVDRKAPARGDAAVAYMIGELCQADTMVSVAELTKKTCDLIANDGLSVSQAIGRVASAGGAVVTEDEKGRRWAHPAGLLRAERSVFRLLRDTERLSGTDRNGPGGNALGNGVAGDHAGDTDPAEHAPGPARHAERSGGAAGPGNADRVPGGPGADLGALAAASCERVDEVTQAHGKPAFTIESTPSDRPPLAYLLDLIDDETKEGEW
jgi:hypothetical protein